MRSKMSMLNPTFNMIFKNLFDGLRSSDLDVLLNRNLPTEEIVISYCHSAKFGQKVMCSWVINFLRTGMTFGEVKSFCYK